MVDYYKKCDVCGGVILVSIFKGGPWCSDHCRKIYEGEVPVHVKSK